MSSQTNERYMKGRARMSLSLPALPALVVSCSAALVVSLLRETQCASNRKEDTCPPKRNGAVPRRSFRYRVNIRCSARRVPLPCAVPWALCCLRCPSRCRCVAQVVAVVTTDGFSLVSGLVFAGKGSRRKGLSAGIARLPRTDSCISAMYAL